MSLAKEPHIPSANTCEHCDKHLRIVHSSTPRCPRCLPDEIKALKTCARCRVARYCTVECQAEHWPQHEDHCRGLRANAMLSQAAGCGERHASFVRWCKHSKNQFVFPAVWILGAGTENDITATHVLMIYLDVEENVSPEGKLTFKRRVKGAKCATEEDIREEFEAEEEWRIEPPQPLCGRVWAVDEALPYGLSCLYQMVELPDIVKVRSEVFRDMDCDWFRLLQDSVDVGTPLTPDPYIFRKDFGRVAT
ncbi:hypothetical protein C8J56DRAFT_14064 [Mycena floridula]|nr:hypothetical protein C8J56DRAFT_14064 [Mycena floridula]